MSTRDIGDVLGCDLATVPHGTVPERVTGPRDLRPPVADATPPDAVKELSEEGMSTRDIGDVLGYSHETVAADLRPPRQKPDERDAADSDDEPAAVRGLTPRAHVVNNSGEHEWYRRDWRASAACAGRDSRWWFTSAHVDPVAAHLAARICATCPVQVECATEAVALLHTGWTLTGTWAGVWLADATTPVRQLEQLAGTDWRP
jgi:hypothetical protein